MKYIVTEKQDINSIREGTEIEASSLTAAKRAATAMQMFQGTIGSIETGGEIVSVREGKKWRDSHTQAPRGPKIRGTGKRIIISATVAPETAAKLREMAAQAGNLGRALDRIAEKL